MRYIVDANFYVLRNSLPWRALPSDFPPSKTVYYWSRRFARKALFEGLNPVLLVLDPKQAGREASPTAAIVISQTVKATEAPAPRDFDGDKKVVGLKCHTLVDVEARILLFGFPEADLHSSRGGGALVKAFRRQWPLPSRFGPTKLIEDSAWKLPLG